MPATTISLKNRYSNLDIHRISAGRSRHTLLPRRPRRGILLIVRQVAECDFPFPNFREQGRINPRWVSAMLGFMQIRDREEEFLNWVDWENKAAQAEAREPVLPRDPGDVRPGYVHVVAQGRVISVPYEQLVISGGMIHVPCAHSA